MEKSEKNQRVYRINDKNKEIWKYHLLKNKDH